MSVLGLDVGTTGCKAVVFDLDGETLGSAYGEYPVIRSNGRLELDSELVWSMICDALREVNAAAAVRRDPVTAMAVTSMGESCTPFDKAGRPLGNSILHIDDRTVPQFEWWLKNVGRQRIFQITGEPPHYVFTLNKIMWLRDNEPELFARTWKVLCYQDMVVHRLGLPPVIDFATAGRTMAFDLRKETWSEELLAIAGVDPAIFAEPKAPGTVIGDLPKKLAADLGFTSPVTVVTGVHDQPAGALGAGVIHENLAMDATGTVECIACAIRKIILTDEMLEGNYNVYHHAVRGLYVTLAFNFTGGALLKWYRDTFGQEEKRIAAQRGVDPYNVIMEEMIEEPSPLLILPHFTSTGTPYFDPHAKGAIVGLTLGTTRGELIKAILEGVSFEIKLNLRLLDRIGVNINELRPIGGGAKSKRWCQLKADMYGRRVVVPNVTEAGCLGVAILAGIGTGQFASMEDALAATVRIQATYEPDPKKQKFYDEKFALYEQLYPALKEISHAL